MTQVLLEELIDSDIAWMTEVGHRQDVAANQFLVRQGETLKAFYIVLEGTLAATLADDLKSDLGQVFAAILDHQATVRELFRFSVGEIVGEFSFFNPAQSPISIQTLEAASLLVLPYEQIQLHLTQDLGFASRFHRAIAILLLNRFEQLLANLTRRRGVQLPPLQDGPLLFSELSDRDVDWMIQHAAVEQVAAGQVLIPAGRLVESLYIVMQGLLSLSWVGQQQNTIATVFDRLQGNNEPTGREISQISRGEVVGEVGLLNSRLSNVVVKALEPSVLLKLPRQGTLLKLQQDPAMAARFYKVLAILLTSKLDVLINRLAYGQRPYQIGASLSPVVQYENEISDELIDGMTTGGARFDWMLRRLKVKGAG